MTRQEEFGVPFIPSEYSVLLLEKAFLQLEKGGDAFKDEIGWQIKHHGWKQTCRIYHYLKDYRVSELPETIRQRAKEDLEEARYMINLANGTLGNYNPDA